MMMVGYFEGHSESVRIQTCPYCGERIYHRYGDGSAECDVCRKRFAVIEIEPKEDETNE